ncbi:hypothetical protein GW17_00011918 [Ensete ventricosum]|nr:hypothetical protein GW17_00011918 [Ensete ventricosum]
MLQEHPSSNPNPEHSANLSHVPLPTVQTRGTEPVPPGGGGHSLGAHTKPLLEDVDRPKILSDCGESPTSNCHNRGLPRANSLGPGAGWDDANRHPVPTPVHAACGIPATGHAPDTSRRKAPVPPPREGPPDTQEPRRPSTKATSASLNVHVAQLDESSKGESPFTPEIQDKLILTNFRLPSLETYDGSSDPLEHVMTFRAHMALYDTSDALMC